MSLPPGTLVPFFNFEKGKHMNSNITTMTSPMTLSMTLPTGEANQPLTLPTLIERFEAEEQHDEPDVVLPLRSLRASSEGLIDVGGREYGVTPWS